MEPATFKLAQLCVESAECYTNQPVVHSIGQEEMEAAAYAESLIQYHDVKDHERQPLEWYSEAQDRKFELIAFLVGTNSGRSNRRTTIFEQIPAQYIFCSEVNTGAWVTMSPHPAASEASVSWDPKYYCTPHGAPDFTIVDKLSPE